MRRISRLIDNEQGVALVMALMILLTLTGLVLAFLSASAFEPQISRNHGETVRARYVAEAGIEYAYDTLASNVGSWNSYLAGATCAQGAVLGGPDSTLPGLGSAHGTFTVRIRNDCKPGDEQLTGVSVDTDLGSCDVGGRRATRPTTATARLSSHPAGTIGTTTRTITVVVSKTAAPAQRRAHVPRLAGGRQRRASSFVIDGRDTRIADRPGAPTGAATAVYGVAVNAGLPALAARLETTLTAGGQHDVRGKDRDRPRARRLAGPIPSRPTARSHRKRSSISFDAAKSAADVTINASPAMDSHSAISARPVRPISRARHAGARPRARRSYTFVAPYPTGQRSHVAEPLAARARVRAFSSSRTASSRSARTSDGTGPSSPPDGTSAFASEATAASSCMARDRERAQSGRRGEDRGRRSPANLTYSIQ